MGDENRDVVSEIVNLFNSGKPTSNGVRVTLDEIGASFIRGITICSRPELYDEDGNPSDGAPTTIKFDLSDHAPVEMDASDGMVRAALAIAQKHGIPVTEVDCE